MGRERFIARMNQRVQEIGISGMKFVNPAGNDPAHVEDPTNTAFAKDIASLVSYLLLQQPAIFDILSLKTYTLYTQQGILHHVINTTNELLGETRWPATVVGGKTGQTPRAQETLLIVLKLPNEKGYIINVILGSENRFQDMKALTDWVFATYQW